MACAFCYYGVVFMSTEILLQDYTAEAAMLAEAKRNSTGGDDMEVANLISNTNLTMIPVNGTLEPCPMLRQADYVELLWTTLAEFPGLNNNLVI